MGGRIHCGNSVRVAEEGRELLGGKQCFKNSEGEGDDRVEAVAQR